MTIFRRRRTHATAAFILFLNMCALPSAAASPSVSLPSLSDSDDLLQTRLARSARNTRLEFAASVSGINNVGSLWDISEKDQPAGRFRDDSAYAVLQMAERVRVIHRGWWIEYGEGRRQAYDGNADAAQLWIDLHADGQTQPAYAPVVKGTRIDVSWWGVGRTFPVRAGNIRGTGSVLLRRITSDDYLSRSLVGQVQGEEFSGMMKVIAANSPTGRVGGEGWAMDVQGTFALGAHWQGQIVAEGLLGKITWRGLAVQDSYILSPRVFADPEGFLRECGGMSGAKWYEELNASINPYYRMDLICTERPHILLGLAYQAGTGSVPSIGLAWPQSKAWLPYLRYYGTQNRLEIGAVGRGWQFRVSGDDWIAASPKHAEVALTASALRF